MSSAGKPLPLVFGKVGEDENDFPKIYERNINVKVIDDGAGKFRVRASLFDLEHSFHAELLVDADTAVIEDATAVMSRRPYPTTYCPRALENVAKLKGQVIGAGINRKIIELVGAEPGMCAPGGSVSGGGGIRRDLADRKALRPGAGVRRQRGGASAEVDADPA